MISKVNKENPCNPARLGPVSLRSRVPTLPGDSTGEHSPVTSGSDFTAEFSRHYKPGLFGGWKRQLEKAGVALTREIAIQMAQHGPANSATAKALAAMRIDFAAAEPVPQSVSRSDFTLPSWQSGIMSFDSEKRNTSYDDCFF